MIIKDGKIYLDGKEDKTTACLIQCGAGVDKKRYDKDGTINLTMDGLDNQYRCAYPPQADSLVYLILDLYNKINGKQL